MKYKDRIVLVTGARRGIGQMLTRHFLDHGAQVIGFSRHDDSDEHAEGYTACAVDVADPDSVTQAFEHIRRRFGRVDIVVNNAAALTSQYAMILSASAARQMLDTNILGVFLVSREGAKLMRKQKWGRIINIGSMASALEPMGDSIYAASKAAVISLGNTMAKEFAALGITCNTIGVSAINTDMLNQLPKEKVDTVISSLPLPRYASAEDIFNVVDFFAAAESGYITAQTIFLGGVH